MRARALSHQAGLILLAAALLVGCATGEAGLREPQLTNPPRTAAWLGWDSAEDPVRTPIELAYSGAFRLPLAEDWRWQMPDVGPWEISRLELNTPVFDGERVLAGNSRGDGFYVLDRTSGRLQRRVEMPGPVQASPLRLPDGWLVADVFGTLQRLDLDFEPVWSAPYELNAGVFRTPVLAGDLVLVSTASETVVALDLADGAWRWSYKRDVPRTSTDLAILGAPSPTVHGDEVLSGFADGAIVGLDLASGQLRWEAQIGTGKFPDVQAEVLVEGDVIIAAGFGGPVVALDAQSHDVVWINEDAGASSAMVLAGDSLYTSDSRGRIQALDPETGQIEWSWTLQGRQFGPLIRAGGWVLVGDVSGTLYALDRFEGTLSWKYQPADGTRLAGIAATPAVDGRQLLVTTAGGQLLSLVADVGVGEDLAEEPRHRRDRVLGW